MKRQALALALAAALAPVSPAVAQEAAPPPAASDAEALAKQLANPIAALISFPVQSNYDWGMGPTGNGWQFKTNIQPVVPVALNADWNMISRTIVPVINQADVVPGNHAQTGLGDVVQSIFFSPQKPAASGWIWGAGPVVLLPTATDPLLGSKKWGLGPTAVVLKQTGAWTYGMLVNQIWSFAGDGGRTPINATFIQPFVGYTTTKATSYTVNMENTYDWTHKQWNAPVNLMVAQLFKPRPGGLPMPIQVQLGYRFYIDKPSGGPDQGIRFSVVALFPR